MLHGYYTEIDERIKYIKAGETGFGINDDLLVSSPLGSCVAVIAYDVKAMTGCMAHVMLPGNAFPGRKPKDQNKYAENAINYLLNRMKYAGTDLNNLHFCLVGGANVLKKRDSFIEKDVVASIYQTLLEKKMVIKAASLGGTLRRSAKLDIETGIVYYTVGNSKEMILWKFNQ